VHIAYALLVFSRSRLWIMGYPLMTLQRFISDKF